MHTSTLPVLASLSARAAQIEAELLLACVECKRALGRFPQTDLVLRSIARTELARRVDLALARLDRAEADLEGGAYLETASVLAA